MNSRINFVILGIVILAVSGCLQPTKEKVPLQPTPTAVPTTTVPATTIATTVPTPLITPTERELPPGTLYVVARMLKPAYWGDSKYELTALKVTTTNQRNTHLSINAQIISDGQILEDNSFTLEGEGNSYQFTNQRNHYINSTNVTLRMQVNGYQPVDYNFEVVNNLT